MVVWILRAELMHCKREVVILAKHLVTVIQLRDYPYYGIQCWKLRTIGVVTDTRLPQNVLQALDSLN